MDITTQADRTGKAGQFADLYEASELKRGNDCDLAAVTAQSHTRLLRTKSVRVPFPCPPTLSACA